MCACFTEDDILAARLHQESLSSLGRSVPVYLSKIANIEIDDIND